ncbi:MAG: hypothetical protein ACRC2T_07550 [Thermoguttaceae bacterium]
MVPESFAANPNILEQKYIDASYVSKEREEKLRQRGYNPLVCERIPKNRPSLVSEVKENNRMKSKIRCHIEHIFGEMQMRMDDETLRVVGHTLFSSNSIVLGFFTDRFEQKVSL